MGNHNFLFVSGDAALVTDLAWQVHTEGHDVKYYIEAEVYLRIRPSKNYRMPW